MPLNITDQYLTHDKIKFYIINEIKPLNKDIFYDPAGGSGGFIEYAIDYIKQNEITHIDFVQNVHVNELDEYVHNLLTSNMSQFGINLNNIHNKNSLDLSWNNQFINKFDCICSNPPFGSTISDNIIPCNHYWAPFNIDYKYYKDHIPKEMSIQFILHIYNSLKQGGRCGIVVPQGIIYNGSNSVNSWESNLRKFLLIKTNLYKIVLLDNLVGSSGRIISSVPFCILFFIKGNDTKEIQFENFNDKSIICKLSIQQIVNMNYNLNPLIYINSDDRYEINIYQLSGELFKTYLLKDLTVNEIKLRKMFNDIPNTKLYKIISNNDIVYTNMYNHEINVILNDHLTIIFIDYDMEIINNFRLNPHTFGNYPEFHNDVEMVKFIVNIDGTTIRYASDNLKNNYDIAKMAIKNNGLSLRFLPNNYRNDHNIVKLAIHHSRAVILAYVSHELQDDADIVKFAIKKNILSYNFASNRLQNDHNIIKFAIFIDKSIYSRIPLIQREHPEIAKIGILIGHENLQYLSPQLRNIFEIVSCAIKKNPYELEYASIRLKNSPNIVKLAVQQNGLSLQYASDNSKDNLDIVNLAIKQNGLSLQYASDNLKNNLDIVKLAVQQNGLSLQYASDNSKNNLDIVKLAVQQNGLSMEYASESIKDDISFAKIVISYNPIVLSYLSDNLKNNIDIVHKAIVQDPTIIRYASDNLKNSTPLVLSVVKRNGLCLRYVSSELKNKKEIVKWAVRQNGLSLQYASDNIKNDIEIVKLAIIQNSYALQYALIDIENNINIIELMCNFGTDLEILCKIMIPILQQFYGNNTINRREVREVDRLITKIESIINRFKNISIENNCQVCLEEYTNEQTPCVLPCCNQIYCTFCLPNFGNNCPQCRKHFEMNKVDIINKITIQSNSNIHEMLLENYDFIENIYKYCKNNLLNDKQVNCIIESTDNMQIIEL